MGFYEWAIIDGNRQIIDLPNDILANTTSNWHLISTQNKMINWKTLNQTGTLPQAILK